MDAEGMDHLETYEGIKKNIKVNIKELGAGIAQSV
jgi:hypothetical protein